MKRKIQFILGVILTSILIVGVLFVLSSVLKPEKEIPDDITRKINFKPFVVAQNSTVSQDNKTIKYDSSQNGISFVVNDSRFGKFTVSQQSSPIEFIDIPDYFIKLVDKLNRYSAFENKLGTVYLTRPNDQKFGQTAVMNASGVLMFIRSEKDLSNDQWNQFFSNFKIME